MNSIVLIDSPTLLFHDLKYQLRNNPGTAEFEQDLTDDHDICYLTVIGKAMRKYEGNGLRAIKIES